jgi:hypothetical protein
LVLALLAYGGISYRVADGITKLDRLPLTPAADSVAPVHEDVSFNRHRRPAAQDAEGCDDVRAFTVHAAEWEQHVFAFLDREIARVPHG